MKLFRLLLLLGIIAVPVKSMEEAATGSAVTYSGPDVAPTDVPAVVHDALVAVDPDSPHQIQVAGKAYEVRDTPEAHTPLAELLRSLFDPEFNPDMETFDAPNGDVALVVPSADGTSTVFEFSAAAYQQLFGDTETEAAHGTEKINLNIIADLAGSVAAVALAAALQEELRKELGDALGAVVISDPGEPIDHSGITVHTNATTEHIEALRARELAVAPAETGAANSTSANTTSANSTATTPRPTPRPTPFEKAFGTGQPVEIKLPEITHGDDVPLVPMSITINFEAYDPQIRGYISKSQEVINIDQSKLPPGGFIQILFTPGGQSGWTDQFGVYYNMMSGAASAQIYYLDSNHTIISSQSIATPNSVITGGTFSSSLPGVAVIPGATAFPAPTPAPTTTLENKGVQAGISIGSIIGGISLFSLIATAVANCRRAKGRERMATTPAPAPSGPGTEVV